MQQVHEGRRIAVHASQQQQSLSFTQQNVQHTEANYGYLGYRWHIASVHRTSCISSARSLRSCSMRFIPETMSWACLSASRDEPT